MTKEIQDKLKFLHTAYTTWDKQQKEEALSTEEQAMADKISQDPQGTIAAIFSAMDELYPHYQELELAGKVELCLVHLTLGTMTQDMDARKKNAGRAVEIAQHLQEVDADAATEILCKYDPNYAENDPFSGKKGLEAVIETAKFFVEM